MKNYVDPHEIQVNNNTWNSQQDIVLLSKLSGSDRNSQVKSIALSRDIREYYLRELFKISRQRSTQCRENGIKKIQIRGSSQHPQLFVVPNNKKRLQRHFSPSNFTIQTNQYLEFILKQVKKTIQNFHNFGKRLRFSLIELIEIDVGQLWFIKIINSTGTNLYDDFKGTQIQERNFLDKGEIKWLKIFLNKVRFFNMNNISEEIKQLYLFKLLDNLEKTDKIQISTLTQNIPENTSANIMIERGSISIRNSYRNFGLQFIFKVSLNLQHCFNNFYVYLQIMIRRYPQSVPILINKQLRNYAQKIKQLINRQKSFDVLEEQLKKSQQMNQTLLLLYKNCFENILSLCALILKEKQQTIPHQKCWQLMKSIKMIVSPHSELKQKLIIFSQQQVVVDVRSQNKEQNNSEIFENQGQQSDKNSSNQSNMSRLQTQSKTVQIKTKQKHTFLTQIIRKINFILRFGGQSINPSIPQTKQDDQYTCVISYHEKQQSEYKNAKFKLKGSIFENGSDSFEEVKRERMNKYGSMYFRLFQLEIGIFLFLFWSPQNTNL